jgi:uncharacterized protein involved in exopolysaccharide biosynthesis
MNSRGARHVPETLEPEIVAAVIADQRDIEASRELQVRYARLLWDHRGTFLRVAALGFVVATALAFLIPKQYTATAELMPPDTQSSSGVAMLSALAAQGGGSSLGSVAGDLLGVKSTGSLVIGVLRSQTSEDGLISRFGMEKVYGSSVLTDARTRLDASTSISEDKKSGIITISVTDHSATRAADITNAYVNQLNSMMSELSTSAAHRERVFLEERLNVVKQDLDDASNQLAQFSSKNNTLDMEQEGKAMLDMTSNLAGQLVAAQSQLEGLRQIYTDNNPRIQSLNARVGEIRKELEKLGGSQETSTANPGVANVGGTSGTETEAAEPTAVPYPTIRNLPLLGVKYGDYYRRAKIEETVYELLTEQYELAKVQEAKETPSVKVLDPAQVPDRKSSPQRTKIVFAGTFVGVFLALLWVIGSAYWHSADPQDPRKVLAREIAGTIKAWMPWVSRSEDDDAVHARTRRPWIAP